MATRFYFTTTSSSFVPTVRGSFTDTSENSDEVYQLNLVKSGTNVAIAGTKSAATNPSKILLHRHISPPLTGGSVRGGSGSFQHVQARMESAAAANLVVFIHIYFTVGSTDVVRFDYLTNFTGATEFATAMTAFSYTTAIPTARTISAGDRLVVEIGYSAPTTRTGDVGTVRVGGTAGDLATSGTTGVTTNSAWFEFLTTESDAALVPLAVTDALAENIPFTVAANNPSPSIFVNAGLSTVITTANNPQPSILTSAGVPTISTTAFDATVTTEGGGDPPNAPAGEIGLTVTANNPGPSIYVSADYP